MLQKGSSDDDGNAWCGQSRIAGGEPRVSQHALRCLHSWQVYLITELLTGGELLDSLLQRGSYNEGDARGCFVQLLRGIEYLHAK